MDAAGLAVLHRAVEGVHRRGLIAAAERHRRYVGTRQAILGSRAKAARAQRARHDHLLVEEEMTHLALGLVLLLTQAMSSVLATAPTLAAMATDPCAVARQIATQRPCLRAEDCGAYQLWTQTFGPPHAVPLEPWPAQGGATPAPAPYCLADPGR